MSGRRFYKLDQALAARKDLTASAKVLHSVIVDRIGKNSKCWAGVRKLSQDCGTSVPAVLRATAELEARGLLAVERRKSGQSNLYRIPGQSAAETEALLTEQALSKRKHSAPKTSAQALPKRKHNQTDPVTRPKKKARRKATPPDPRVRQFIDWFTSEYQQSLGRDYVVTGGKDGATAKRLLKSVSLDELQRATKNMLADAWGRERASIGLLSSQINTWRGSPGRKPKAGSFTPAETPDTSVYANIGKRYE